MEKVKKGVRLDHISKIYQDPKTGKDFYAVHDVEEFCGITHDGPKLNRNYKNGAGKVIEPFEPKKNILKIPRLLKMKKQLKLIENISKN